MRFEMNDASVELEIVGPGADLAGDEVPPGTYALIIGDPWASAYAIEASADELREFARRVAGVVAQLPLDDDQV